MNAPIDRSDIDRVNNIRQSLLSAGYYAIPVRTGDKVPVGFGWQKPKASPDMANVASMNTGILCAGLRVIDIDIDNESVARSVYNMAIDMLGWSPTRYRDNSARRLIVYRASHGEPRKSVLTSPTLKNDDGKPSKVEILGKGQQFVAYGTHPSGASLEWLDADLCATPISDLTEMADDDVGLFLDAVAPLLGVDDREEGERNVPPNVTTSYPLQNEGYEGAGSNFDITPKDRSMAEIHDLLYSINADCGYDDWYKALMAVHYETNGYVEGMQLVDQWSSQGKKYKRGEVAAKWKSFKGGGVTGGTLAALARSHGADLSAIASNYVERGPEPTAADYAFARKLVEKDGTLHDAETGEVIDDAPVKKRKSEFAGTADDYFDMPDHMLNPSGVVGEIADWICAWTDTPLRIHAVGVALGIVGTIIGRKVYTQTRPTGCHLYIGAISPSSVGKQHAQDCAKILLDAVATNLHSGWQASGPAFADTVNEGASRLMVADEFADKLQALKGRNAASSMSAISEVFRELWGLSIGSYHPPRALVRSDYQIHRPCLSFYGAATTRDFKESMTAKDVTNGLFNRFLILPRYELPKKVTEPEGIISVPDSLLAKCKAMYNCLPPLCVALATRGDGYPSKPILVPFTDEAKRMNDANRVYQDSMREMADDDAPLSLYGRYAEQIKRVALVIACSRHYNNLNMAQIQPDDMKFAENLVKWSIEQFVLMVRRDMVESATQAQYKLVLEIIRKASKIDRSTLYRRINGRIKRRELDDILLSLDEGASIRIDKIEPKKTGGRPKYIYHFVTG